MCLTMHFRGLSPNMDINLDLTSFSRAMDCDLRQQGGDKKHKNREDFSQNVGLHKILLLYSHLFNNFYRTVPSARETCEVREDGGYVGQERAAGHHHEDRGAAEEQPAGDTIIICICSRLVTCDVRHGKIWSSSRLRLMNSWSLFWRILKTR